MTELSPDRIIAKLEKDGRAVVAHKLKSGVYADYKLPLIRKWLKEKDTEEVAGETVNKPNKEAADVDAGQPIETEVADEIASGTVSEVTGGDPPTELTGEVVFGSNTGDGVIKETVEEVLADTDKKEV